MRRIKGFWLYIIVAVVVIVGIVVVRQRRAAAGSPGMQTAVAARGTVMSSVAANGVLQPLTTVEVRSNVGGQVVELTVDEGDLVEAGQLIARIDPSDSLAALDQAKADHASAKARVDQALQAVQLQRLQTATSITSAEQALLASRERWAQAEREAEIQPTLTAEALKQAESSLASAQANLEQTRSALIPQKVASAQAAYDQAKASCDQAEQALKRQHALLAKGYTSKSQADEAEAQYAAAKAQLESAQAKLDTVQEECQQDLRSAEAQVAQAKAALESARANRVQDELKQKEVAASRAAAEQAAAALKAAQASSYSDQMKVEDVLQARAALERARAAVTNADTQLSYTTIVAPRSGIVVAKYVEEGSIVTAGRQAFAGSGSGITIVEIADVSRMRVVVDVDEADIAKIRLGQLVTVTVDACPDEEFPAKVTKIAPKAEVNQNVTTIPVTVELDETDERLKPEMNASCGFLIDRRQQVLCVPFEAITETDAGPQVTVLENGKPVHRKVVVGLAGDDLCEIVRGLKEGETVVIGEEEQAAPTGGRRGGPGGMPPPPM
jgi:HlyD family secretion protein